MQGTVICFSCRHARLASAACVIAVLLSACAADFASIRPGLEQRGHYIEGVPFYKQNDNECGPPALAGIISFWGRSCGLDGIAYGVNLGRPPRTLPEDMEQYLRKAGFETVSLEGTVITLTDKLRQNIPIVTLLDIGFSSYRIMHYVTVIGFDDVNKVFIVHDGITPNKVLAYDAFFRYWSKADFWMMVAVPESVKGLP